MKKNFLMVAALLIAAMLMVVSCTQEVAPKNELVEASFSVGFGKDIKITDFDGKNITYVYSVKPKWSKLDNGVDPYGAVTNKKIDTKKTIADRVENEKIGYLTPGLWEVSVEGYVGYTDSSSKGTLVVAGKTNTYFTKDKTSVTVLVSPVESGTATVNLELQMQDLKDKNEIKVEFAHIGGEFTKTVNLKDEEGNGVTVTSITVEEKTEAAYKYVLNGVSLDKTGFYTVKVTVPGYEGSGYVRTFLATNGSTITIKGSVYPSEFINSTLDIISISVDSASLNIVGTKDTNNYYSGEITFTLNDNNNTYLNNAEIESLKTSYGVSSVSVAKEYSWYINGTKVEGEGISNETKEIKKTFDPGVYSVSCVITYSVTFDYTTGDDVTKVFVGDAHTAEFVVKQ